MLGGKGENLGKYNRQRLNKNRGKRMVLPAKKMECFEILIIRSLSHFFLCEHGCVWSALTSETC
jgi:hypothetical protein